MSARVTTRIASVVVLVIGVTAGLPTETHRTLQAGHRIALAGEPLAPPQEYESDETLVTSPLRKAMQERTAFVNGAEKFVTDVWWLGSTLPLDTPGEYASFDSSEPEEAGLPDLEFGVTDIRDEPTNLDTNSSDTWFKAQALSEPVFGIPFIAGIGFVDHEWGTASLPIGISDPVVIVGPPSRYGSNPGVMRIRNVSQQGFEIRFQEWAYLDNWHVPEHVSFIMLPKGRTTLLDGSEWEIGIFALDGTGKWMTQQFSRAFAGRPELFLTIQTYNGSQPVVVRARNVSAGGFDAALFEEEGLMDGHNVERIGYVAVHSPLGWGSVLTELSAESFLFQHLTLDDRFTPVLSTSLQLEEEQSWDEEIDHIDEQVSVFAIGPIFFAQVTSFNGPDTVALRRLAPEYAAQMEWGMVSGLDHAWKRVPLSKAFTQPVVIAKPVSSQGSDPGVVRLRNVQNTWFDMRFQEWTYLDDIHYSPEQVFYLVAEAGIRQEPDLNLQIAAGTLQTDALARLGSWEEITIAPIVEDLFVPPVFPDRPAAFATVQTYNGTDPVTTRIRDVHIYGFEVAMDEQESRNDGHAIETVGWIALARGSGRTSDGRGVWVFDADGGVSEAPVTTYYPQAVDRRYPVVVADVSTTEGPDPVSLRFTEINQSGIQLYLAEEQSLDQEITHVPEVISVFMAE